MSFLSNTISILKKVQNEVCGNDSYCVIYGSRANNTYKPDSDLDLLTVGQFLLDQNKKDILIDRVQNLHNEFGFNLDNEVSYDVKLYATFDEVNRSAQLHGFDILSQNSEIIVPEIIESPVYLNSDKFKSRLLLNVLTGSHLFVSGNRDAYQKHRRNSATAITALTLSMQEKDNVSVEDMVSSLLTSKNGLKGQDYLGYKNTVESISDLTQTLKLGAFELSKKRILTFKDGKIRVKQDVFDEFIYSMSDKHRLSDIENYNKLNKHSIIIKGFRYG